MACLWPTGGSLDEKQVFSVVDGARHSGIAPMLQEAELEQACLLSGRLTPALTAAAPRLLHLSYDAPFTRSLFQAGWSDHWFVLVRVAPGVALDFLRRHLRTLLRVCDEDGRRFMFRFYDPRVLRPYLGSCNPEEAALVFGPIEEFVCAGADSDAVLLFRRGREGVTKEVRMLEC